jgi:hypothetical protein
MSPILQKITIESPLHLQRLIESNATDIDADFSTIVELAKDDDKPPKLTLSLAITINPDEHAVSNKLSWSVKRQAESCFKIDDPNQPELVPSGVSSVTISTVETSVTIDAEGAKRMKRNIDKMRNK